MRLRYGRIVLLIYILTFTACLKDERLEIGEIDISQSTALKIILTNNEYKLGELVEIDLNLKEEANLYSFDLELDHNFFTLDSLKKYEFSEECIVLSRKTEKGYNFIFYDEQKNLKKNENFAKIGLYVRKTGYAKLKFNELIKE